MALLRSLGMTVYAPTFLFSLGQGAVLPIIALAALDVGASLPAAGLIVAANGVGAMAAGIPGGLLVGRLGERRAMTVATVVLVVSLLGAVLSGTAWALGVCVFLMGCGWSVWMLARLSYVTDVAPIHLRGRALSTLGGVNRIGNFAGPFLGAAAITVLGLSGSFYVHIAAVVAGWGVLMRSPDLQHFGEPLEQVSIDFRRILSEHAAVFATAGAAPLGVGILRAARYALIPLWAAHIGLEPALAALVFGISSALDMLLFYPAGSASDRFGRKSVAIPCMTLMAAGFLLLPATSTFSAMVLVGLLIGFGNGLGSGIIMTLGADFSPARGRAEFLGVWRTLGEVGAAGGPVIASAITALASLGAAAIALGGIGLIGAGVVLFAMPEPTRRSPARPEGAAED